MRVVGIYVNKIEESKMTLGDNIEANLEDQRYVLETVSLNGLKEL